MSSPTDRTSPPPGISRRRSSFTGQFADFFGRPSSGSVSSGSGAYPGPITTAAAQAQHRRLSLSTVGLSGSPNQPSPFTPGSRPRAGSISSSNSGTVDESPFEDMDMPSQSVPTTPFARRLSFGARAMRDMKSAGASGNGSGFDFAENMRLRAERSSISGPSGPNMPQRSRTMATMETPTIREAPKQTKVPDAIQERILRGDFYMD